MRRIKHAVVKRLALCKRGKNGLQTVFKSDGSAQFATMVKGEGVAERGELLSVMWPKGLADADGDFSDTDQAIKSMTSSLIANGGQLDIEHDGKVLPPGAAYVSEVFTIQAGDERFQGWKDYSGEVQDVTGGAAVKIQIDDPELRAAYRDGDWDGVSLFGDAAVEHVDIKAASQRVAARMGGVQEKKMDETQLQAVIAALKANTAELVKSAVDTALEAREVAEAKVKAEAKAKAEAEAPKAAAEDRPTFTGDPLDPEAMASYERALRSYELKKAVMSGDMTADKLAEMRKSLSASQSGPSVAELKEAGIPAQDSDSKEVRDLQLKLFKSMRSGSNAPAAFGSDDEVSTLEKANANEGAALAALINTNMGSARASGMQIHNS